MRSISFIAAALALAGCAVQNPVRPPVISASAATAGAPGIVSAADPRAAEAGASILRQGGSAADAAIATMLALTVVEPQSSGIGGGSYLVFRNVAGDIQTYDGRETAPLAASGDWFMADGKPRPFPDVVPGGTSVGVPGNMRMAAEASRDHGKLPWKALFQPAIAFARDGFLVTPRLHEALAGERSTADFSPAGRALFYTADGQPLAVGTRVRNPALAAFLTTLSERGADAFYVGPNAQAIVTTVSTAPHNPSPMTVGDVARYDAKPAPPCAAAIAGTSCAAWGRHRRAARRSSRRWRCSSGSTWRSWDRIRRSPGT